MRRGFSQRSGPYLLVGLMLLLVFLGRSNMGRRMTHGLFTPFISAWHWSVQRCQKGLDWLQPWFFQQDRQAFLEARLVELQAKLAAQMDLQQENAELRRLRVLPEFPSWQAVVAAVTVRDPLLWNQGFMINKGEKDGLVVGAVVLSGGDVIGRVIELYKHGARVATLASTKCRFSVLLEGTEIVGVGQGVSRSEWHAEPRFQVDYLPKELQLQPGQRLLSSGMGGSVPGGLPLGMIILNEQGRLAELVDAARSRLLATPLADFGIIRFVTVLCPK